MLSSPSSSSGRWVARIQLNHSSSSSPQLQVLCLVGLSHQHSSSSSSGGRLAFSQWVLLALTHTSSHSSSLRVWRLV